MPFLCLGEMGHPEFRVAKLRVEGFAFDQMRSIDANWKVVRLPDLVLNLSATIPAPRFPTGRKPGGWTQFINPHP